VPTPDALIRAQSNIHAYLASASRDDSMFASARDLSLVSWATELHSAIDKTASVIPKLAAEKTDEATATKERLESLLPRLRDALKGAWEGDADVFGIE
jgi:cohesin loading factor subunit SCC2